VVRGGGHIAQSLPCTGSQHHGTSTTGAITKYPCYLDVKAKKDVIFKNSDDFEHKHPKEC
jgi:hypothetical protein